MKQQDLQMMATKLLFSVLATGVASAAMAFVLRRILARSNTSDLDIKAALQKLYSIEKERGRELKELTLTEHEAELIKDVISPADIDVDFNSIGALADVKKSLREVLLLPLNRPELFEGRQSKLLQPPKGILLYGPPGTGKTMMAKAIAKEGKLAFINVNLSTILNKWYGESEKIVRSIFTLAHKLQPCVVFFDEMDCFFHSGAGGGAHHSYQMQVESVFLTLWDGILTDSTSRVVVIGATNRPYNLSAAILRRMPLQFLFDLPNKAQRAQILSVVLANEPLAPGFSIDTLARLTSGYSGSDLQELCKKAAVAPLRHFLAEEERRAAAGAAEEEEEAAHGLRPMEMQDFIDAMKEVGPTGKKAKQYHGRSMSSRAMQENDEDEADDESLPKAGGPINMASLLQLWSAVLGGAAASSSSPPSSSTFSRPTNNKRPTIEEVDDEDVESLSSTDQSSNDQDLEKLSRDARIEKWSQRFEGESGVRLMEQLCALVDIDPSQPKPVVIRELAQHFLDL